MKLIAAFLAGILFGMTFSLSGSAAGDGWSNYEIRTALGLLERIVENTRK